MAALTLFVPDLSAWLVEGSAGEIDPARWPALSLMLTRAIEHPLESYSLEHNLIMLCGAHSAHAAPIPIAALTALIDYGSPSLEDVMRADPVHLRADPNQILLFNHPSIMPSAAEADSLLEELNLGIPDLGISRGRHPGRWYLRSEYAASTVTSSPSAAKGRSIADHLPRGDGARALTQLMNDVQMILHNAAVNAEREARGAPPLNSIWPWGNGCERYAQISSPDFVVGDDVLAAGSARHFGLDWYAELEPREVVEKIRRGDGNGLLVIGSPTGSMDSGDPMGGIDDLEQRWCRLLLHSLRRFQIKEVQLITDRYRYSLTPYNLFKGWLRPRRMPGGAI